MKKQILKNIFSNYASRLLGLVLSLFLVPFLITKLGSDAFGLIAVAESSLLIFETITVSVRTALGRHAAYALASGKPQAFESYLSTGRRILLFSAAIAFMGGCAVSWYFPVIFRMPVELKQSSQQLFFLITIAFSASVPNAVYWAALYSKKRVDLINIASSAAILIRSSLILVVFSVVPPQYATLTTYGLIYVVVTLSQNYSVYLWCRRIMPDFRLSSKAVDKHKMREILSYSVHTSLMRLNTWLSDTASTFLINIFWGTTANAVYSVAKRLPMVLRQLFVETSWSLTPFFTELAAKNDRARIKKLFFMYTKAMTLLLSPVYLSLLIFSGAIMRLWLGDRVGEATSLLPVLAAPIIFSIPFSVCGCINSAFGRVKLPSRLGFVNALVNISLGVLLGKTLGWGLLGMATGAVVCNITYSVLFAPTYACRNAGIPVLEYWRKAFLEPVIPALVFVGLPMIVLKGMGWHGPTHVAQFAATGAWALLFYGTSFKFLFSETERVEIFATLRSLSPRTAVKEAEIYES